MNLHNHLPFPLVNPLANPLIKAVRSPLIFRGGGGGGGGGRGLTGPPYTDILLFSRFEAATMVATDDYYGNDDTWGFGGTGGDAEISSTRAKHGTSSLRCWATTSGDTAFGRLIPLNNDISPHDEGRIGFWWNWLDLGDPLISDGCSLYATQYDTYDTFSLEYYPYNGRFMVQRRVDSTYSFSNEIITGAPTLDTWYFIEFAWKLSTDYAEVWIDGVSIGYFTVTLASWDSGTDSNRMSIGINTPLGTTGFEVFFDHFMTSNNSTRNLYALRNETSSPRVMS